MKLKAYKKSVLLLESLFERVKEKRLKPYINSVENGLSPDFLEVNNLEANNLIEVDNLKKN
jgi:hypothetical protein